MDPQHWSKLYVGPALDVGVTPVRRVPVKDDGMPETPELETINLRALLRSSELFQLEFRIRKHRLVTSPLTARSDFWIL
jgi:hypothetical protein